MSLEAIKLYRILLHAFFMRTRLTRKQTNKLNMALSRQCNAGIINIILNNHSMYIEIEYIDTRCGGF